MTLTEFVNKYKGKRVCFNGACQLYIPVFKFCRFSYLSCLIKRIRTAKINHFIVHFYLNTPLRISVAPIYTNISRFIIFSNSPISKIGSIRTYTKIFSSIVKRIIIYMVNRLIFWRIHQISLYFYNSFIEFCLRIKPFSFKCDTPLFAKFFQFNIITFIKQHIMCAVSFTNYFPFLHTLSLPNDKQFVKEVN